MKWLPKAKRMRIYYNETETVQLPEFVGMNWMVSSTRMESRLKIQR